MKLPVAYDPPEHFDSVSNGVRSTAVVQAQPAASPTQANAWYAPAATGVVDAPCPVGAGALVTLGEAVTGRMKAKQGSAWVGKTLSDAKTSARLLVEYFGASTPVDTITKKMAREYRSDLGRIPAMHGKLGRYHGLTLKEAVAEADAFDEEIESGAIAAVELTGRGFRNGKVARLTLKTGKKHLSFAKGVFDQIMEDDTRLQMNPFAGLQYSNAEIEKQGGNARQMWRDQDIAALLASPIWSGCAGPDQRDVPGDQLIKDARYWVPLLALFAGLRLEEACQLEADDIRNIEGVDCICVDRGPYKTVKSASSVRQIPVHSVLKKIGLLELAARRRGVLHTKLFPELERAGPHKLYGYAFSKSFTAYRRSVDLYELWMDFHSLRTTFSTNILRQKKVDTLVSVLLGHKLQGLTSTNYFRGFRVEDMVDTVELVDFGKYITRWS
jgi:integrase